MGVPGLRHFLAGATVLVALAGPAAAQTVVKFADVVPEGPAAEIEAMKAFKKYVEFRSDNKLQVQLLMGSVGGEREITEQVKQGTLEMGLAADGAVAGFYKNIQVFSIPYLFPSAPVAWQFFDHPFAKKVQADMLKQTGIRTLSFSENGFRNMTNNVRPIKTPDDMKGIKMRTMESPVFMNFMKSMGAAPTPISAAEMVLALKQGVVDGQENPTLIIYDFGIADVQKFMSLDEHIYSVHLIEINDEFYKKLPPEQQRILEEGARVFRAVAGTRKAALQAEYIDKIKAKGVAVYINSATEKEAFRKVTQTPVREFIEAQVGKELVQELLAAVADSTKAVYGN